VISPFNLNHETLISTTLCPVLFVFTQIFEPEVEEKKFRAVFPNASISESSGCRSWNAFGVGQSSRSPVNRTDDVAYIRYLFEDAQGVYSVDKQRRYIIGNGLGAIMGQSFACEYPHELAAVASIEGVPPADALSDPASCPAVSENYTNIDIVALHHLQIVNDDQPAEESFTAASAEDVSTAWANLALCNGSVTTSSNALNLVDGSASETDRSIYGRNCTKAGSSELWNITAEGADSSLLDSANDGFSDAVAAWMTLFTSDANASSPLPPLVAASNDTSASPPASAPAPAPGPDESDEDETEESIDPDPEEESNDDDDTAPAPAAETPQNSNSDSETPAPAPTPEGNEDSTSSPVSESPAPAPASSDEEDEEEQSAKDPAAPPEVQDDADNDGSEEGEQEEKEEESGSSEGGGASTSTSSDGNSMSTGEIGGIVAAGVVGAALIATFVGISMRRQRSNGHNERDGTSV
jgi:pimeloyl-ACP methyl ester carboxylesterase